MTAYIVKQRKDATTDLTPTYGRYHYAAWKKGEGC
jgi:hypothetical protein